MSRIGHCYETQAMSVCHPEIGYKRFKISYNNDTDMLELLQQLAIHSLDRGLLFGTWTDKIPRTIGNWQQFGFANHINRCLARHRYWGHSGHSYLPESKEVALVARLEASCGVFLS